LETQRLFGNIAFISSPFLKWGGGAATSATQGNLILGFPHFGFQAKKKPR
jgi:hypothetical protein